MNKTNERKPHILWYTDTTQIGGAEQHILQLAKQLDKERFIATLACSNDQRLDRWCKSIGEQGIDIIRINALHKHDPRHYFALKQIIYKEEVDLIHIHVTNPASNRWGLLAALRGHTPYVITEHDPFRLSMMKEWIKRKLITEAARIIAVSEQNKKLLTELYPFLANRITTIHNGIDTTWFESQLLSFSKSDRDRYRTSVFDNTDNAPILVAVAELHPRKGLIHLLKSAAQLQEKRIAFKLVIAGEGRQRNELETFIAEHRLTQEVTLLGQRKDIPQILAASDIFILPSLHEAFGLVLLEAMIARLPIIASRSGGVPEIVTEGENGILVPPEDSAALTEAIISLINNPARAQEMSEKNHEKVRMQFDSKIMAKKTGEVYTTVLAMHQQAHAS